MVKCEPSVCLWSNPRSLSWVALPHGRDQASRGLEKGRRLKIGLFSVGAAALLSACATPEPRIITKEVKVPVPVPCAADPGPDPAFSDTPEALRAAASDLFEQVRLLLAGRAQRDARLAELKGAVAGCR